MTCATNKNMDQLKAVRYFVRLGKVASAHSNFIIPHSKENYPDALESRHGK